MSNLPAGDRKIVQLQLKQLPPRTKAAQEKEMGEMMGKLKEVCSRISVGEVQRLTLNSLGMAF
jgi:hypothetical protein